MRAALHILEPPPRQHLVHHVKGVDRSLEERLAKSRHQVKLAKASALIYSVCMRWYGKKREKKIMKLAVLEAQRREKEMLNSNYAEADDELMSYASSLESKSVKSGK
jgi:hypothetical protein